MEVYQTERLRLSKSDELALQEVFDADRFVWNTALGRWQDLWRYEGLHLSWQDMCKELTDWRSRFDWLAAVPSVPQQQVIRNLGKSIRAFCDQKNPARRPKFKRRGTHTTATWTTRGFTIKDGRLSVAVRGGRIDLRVVWSRPLPSVPKSVTIFRDAAGHWWVSFPVWVELEDIGVTGRTTGLDLGLTTFATTEFPDADIPNPRFGRGAAKALARSQRNMSRTQKGSNNRARARKTFAKVHAHVANQRKDWCNKQARKLARHFDRIGVEDLKINNMRRKRGGKYKTGLNRAISDASWGNFLQVLAWQSKKCGHEVIRINPRNTTQTCSQCGTKAKERLGLADRIFACEVCDLVLDRDRNAARNLNPDRLGNTVRVGQGVDGKKSRVPAGIMAARAPESLAFTSEELSVGPSKSGQGCRPGIEDDTSGLYTM